MKQVDRLVIYLKDSQKYSEVFEDDVANCVSVSFEVKDSILSVKKEVLLDDGEYIERDTVCYPMENVKSFNYKEYDTPVEADDTDEVKRPEDLTSSSDFVKTKVFYSLVTIFAISFLIAFVTFWVNFAWWVGSSFH